MQDSNPNDTSHHERIPNSVESRRRADDFNRQHTCTPGQLRNKPASSHQSQIQRNWPEKRERFVESLAAPRAFLGYITIEPVAFLATLALYIEFPAIQDLIYTKVCLEIVAKYPNLTTTGSSNASPNLSRSRSATTQPGVLLFALPNINSTRQQPPSSGRIQQTSENANVEVPTQFSGFNTESRDHLLCDRLNRSATPAFIRQEILDIDSIFWLKYQIIICGLCALSSPYWGGISDRIGRLVTLNVPIVCGAICNLISLIFGLLISLESHALFHLNWLHSGAILVGMSGGQAVLVMNAFSYISDTSTSEERTKRVTILESVIYVSHSFGFLLSKLVMSLGLAPPGRVWLNRHFVAFTSCIVLNLMGSLYSWFKLRHHKYHRFLNNFEREQREAAIVGGSDLPDPQPATGTRSPATSGPGDTGVSGGGERLREFTSSASDDLNANQPDKRLTIWGAMATVRYYRDTYSAATKARDSRPIILLLLLSGFLSAVSLATLMSLLFIYLKMDPFNWSTSQYSDWNFVTSITRGLALIALTLCMRFMSNWSVPDPLVAAVGFLGKAVGLLMIGLAQSSETIYWTLAAFVLSEYSMPPIRSLLSKLVIKDELGKIYSCLGALQSVCFILGNVAFYLAFTTLERHSFFRLSFLVVAGIEFSAVIIMLIIYAALRRRRLIVV